MSLSGIETLHPDVFVIEERGLPAVIGVSVNTGGFVGVAEKGPVDVPVLITNRSQFHDRFGDYFAGNVLERAVNGFFDEGGIRCWCVRVLGAGATSAATTLVNHELAPSVEIDAISGGAWGNNLAVTTEAWRTAVADGSILSPVVPPVGNGSIKIPLLTVRNVRRGDQIVVSDPGSGNKIIAFVYAIDVGNRVVTVRSITGLPALFTFPIGSLVQCGSVHRLSTTITAPLAPGDIQAKLTTTNNLTIGARLYFDDGINFASVVVTQINGPIVGFAPIVISGAATLPAITTIAATQEFTLRVTEKGQIQEIIDGLSMEPTNSRDYFGIRLVGSSNESIRISAIDLGATPVDVNNALPFPALSQVLLGGTEGLTPTNDDYIGSPVPPVSGMFLLDQAPSLNFFSIPGITLLGVQQAMVSFAEGKGDLVAVLETPLAITEAVDALNYRQITLNQDSSYAALYFPWLVEVDPVIGNSKIFVPPSGRVQGQYANVGATRGVQFAPANVPLRNVIGLTHDTSNGEQDLLNPNGVNVIRSFLGEGIRIWGARTLTTFFDGKQYVNVRRTLNFIKDSLKTGLRFAVFELNEPRTWNVITLACTNFLRNLFLQGVLFSPDGDPARAFFVKCDAETNPDSQRALGRLNVQIGVNPQLPAEFVIVTLGLYDGGTTVEEALAQQ